MRKIFESIRVVLPLSVNEAKFAAPENRVAIEQALAALADNAGALASHARGTDPARRYLGDSLEHDAREALDRYRAGHFEGAAFQIRLATENCVACHTKLHSPGTSPAAQHFVDRSALAGLPLAERARLEVATRQFDEAAASYEKLLASPKVPPSELLTPLVDYLIVEVRVKGDFERPAKTLARFAKRPDLWRHLRADVEEWIRALRELRPLSSSAPDLATARDLITRARSIAKVPADYGPLVHYLVASSVLQRFLATTPPPSNRDAAEAYYLLGLAETHVGDTYWVSQADIYLETAIRLAPREPSALEAYLVLEEETVASYTGSQGEQLPVSVAEHLEELRALVDAK
jgi:tetratricopeptide (TPR) repeat protein